MNQKNFLLHVRYNNFVRVNIFGSDSSFLTPIGILTNRLHLSQIHHIYAVSDQ